MVELVTAASVFLGESSLEVLSHEKSCALQFAKWKESLGDNMEELFFK